MSTPGLRSLLAVVSQGFEPVGVLLGALGVQIIRPVGCMSSGYRDTGPLVYEGYEEALRAAWAGVVDRLEAEAAKAGAHGVVGVSVRGRGVGEQTLQLVGTGVRVSGQAPLRRPFLSMLSMDETLKLLLRGWVPAGIGIGVSAVHVHGVGASPLLQGTPFTNAEMGGPTAAMALARSRAEGDVRRSLAAVRAEGIVAAEISLSRSVNGCGARGGGLLIEGFYLGTGVVRFGPPAVAVAAVRDLTGARPA